MSTDQAMALAEKMFDYALAPWNEDDPGYLAWNAGYLTALAVAGIDPARAQRELESMTREYTNDDRFKEEA